MALKLLCKKSLYKSTYKGNAFIAGKHYEVVEEGKEFVWLSDEHAAIINLSIDSSEVYYELHTFFHYGKKVKFTSLYNKLL